ncbi:MAG: hypothetical protein V7K21_17495, partial [Nostoc sp.]
WGGRGCQRQLLPPLNNDYHFYYLYILFSGSPYLIALWKELGKSALLYSLFKRVFQIRKYPDIFVK